MHIGLCSPQWPPGGAANGIVTYVSSLRGYFMSQGHAVSVISQGSLFDTEDVAHPLEPPSPPSFRSVWKRRLSRRMDTWHGGLPGLGQNVARQIVKAHRIAPIDIVEMEESFGWSGIVQKRAGLPVVTRLHGPHFLKPTQPKAWRERLSDTQRTTAEGRAIRAARALSAPTRNTMDAVCTHYSVNPGVRRAVIPNPVTIVGENDRWRLSDCEPEHMLMVGRFDYWKGADTMLAAFARLLTWRPEARLTLVGPDLGIRNQAGQAVLFEEYAEANLATTVRERVTFTGILPADQIRMLRKKAYVTVVASRLENFPYALVEGMAAGCPVISTDWPGSDEIVHHGETGLLSNVGEPEPLARHLHWLMGHPESAASIAANGFEHCRRHYSVETVGNDLLRYYETTIQAAVK